MGASGHGKVIEDLAVQIGCYDEIAFLDDNEALQESNPCVIGNSGYAIEHKEECEVIVAVGDAKARRELHEKYRKEGVCMATLVHPDAVMPYETVRIGNDTVIMAGAVIQSGTEIGDGVIVNTACSIDHECRIGDYCHIAVGSHLAGGVFVGNGSWVGAGAVVSNQVSICPDVIIGAGAAVVRNIVESGTYVGVPVRRLK